MFYSLGVCGFLLSCANIGRPDGGPFDEMPPKLVSSNPKPEELNVSRTRIVLDFDEFIKLEKANEKVVISPPQIQQPEIRPNGKRISINLADTLKANTTYTIDFSDAIVDNNEGNPMGNFSFTFSTGNAIDTMEVSGTVLDASNLEPIKGMSVGLHRNLADTAFTKLPFDRVAITDSRGHFIIRGIAPGKYRLFGLQDMDQNFAFTQKSEALAFNDSIITPVFERRMRQDTVWKDTITVDTIIEREYSHYLPDDLILRAFKEETYSQYLIKNERLTPQKFSLYFAEKADTLPTLKGLNFDDHDAFIIDKSIGNDTIHYWVRDSLLYKQDTLSVSLQYLYTDTLGLLIPRTDTLNMAVRGVKNKETAEKKKRKGKEEEGDKPETLFLKPQVYCPGQMDVYDYIYWVFEEPLAGYSKEMIHLRQKKDTLWHDIPYEFEHDPIDIKRFNLYYEWEPATEYQLQVDSTAFYGLYGLHTDKSEQNFKTRALDEYAELFFNIEGADSIAFVELLDTQDKVVRKIYVENERADFYYLKPGKYGARLINDSNGNGVWDTGIYEKGEQPEEVYYYPQITELKAIFQIVQNWDLKAKPLDKQKPNELKKQKPDEERKKKIRERDRSQNNNNSGNNLSMPPIQGF
jgi:hypothetical protein